mgnify:CR=1 FL=1
MYSNTHELTRPRILLIRIFPNTANHQKNKFTYFDKKYVIKNTNNSLGAGKIPAVYIYHAMFRTVELINGTTTAQHFLNNQVVPENEWTSINITQAQWWIT